MEMLGFEPRTFRMQSERSTTELHPQDDSKVKSINKILLGRCGSATHHYFSWKHEIVLFHLTSISTSFANEHNSC